MTVEELIIALIRQRARDDALVELSFDDDQWWSVTAAVVQAEGNVTLEVEPL